MSYSRGLLSDYENRWIVCSRLRKKLKNIILQTPIAVSVSSWPKCISPKRQTITFSRADKLLTEHLSIKLTSCRTKLWSKNYERRSSPARARSQSQAANSRSEIKRGSLSVVKYFYCLLTNIFAGLAEWPEYLFPMLRVK